MARHDINHLVERLQAAGGVPAMLLTIPGVHDLGDGDGMQALGWNTVRQAERMVEQIESRRQRR